MSVAVRLLRLAPVIISLAAVPAGYALAQQDFPNRPIKMILPTSPGSGSDIIGRVIANQLSGALGQPVVPDNRPGASGVIGVNATRNSPPDGYTVAFSNVSQLVQAPLSVSPVPYDPVKDVEAVAVVYRVLLVLAANASVPAKNLRELVSYAKANPGKLNYSSPGAGTFAHLWAELLKKREGIEMVHVPYKGAGLAFQSVMAGETQLNPAESLGMGAGASSPNIRILVQLGEKRGAKFANVETLREAGYPELTSDFWFGFIGPKGIAPAILRRWNEEIHRAMASPEVQKQVSAAGGENISADLATSAAIVANDHKIWAPIIRELGIKQ